VSLDNQPLPHWARAADALVLGLIALALFVAIEGGVVVWSDALKLSIKSEWRVIAWALALAAVRHFFVHQQPLHRRISETVGGAARAAGPLPDDFAAAPPGTAPIRGRVRFYAVYSVVVVAAFSALTLVMTYPQVRYLGNGVSTDDGDALFSVWRLAWVAHQLARNPAHLFDANIFYPERGALAYSDAMLFPGLMAAPLHWLGVPPLLVYNLIFLGGFALSGAAMFLLVRSLTHHTGAAFLSGFVFAFLPYRFMHYAHLELQLAFCMPLCLWAVHRLIKYGRVRDGLLAGIFFVLQCLSSWYYGIFLATFLVPFTLALLAGEDLASIKRSLRALSAGGVLAALLVVPTALPYFSARRAVGERPLEEIVHYSATPRDYLTAHHRNTAFGKLTERWAGQERELFMGIAVPLIALIGLWPPLSAARIAYALGLVFAFDLSLGFNGLLYPWFHEYVLPYRGLRVPARMAMVIGLGLAVLTGFGAARILRALSRRGAARVGFLLLASLIFVEYRSTLTLKRIPSRPPPIYDALPQGPGTVVLELPLLQPDIALEPTYMYFSTFHWHKLVNGYSGFKPPSYHELVEKMANFPDRVSLAELRRRGTTHVIVHQRYYRPGDYLEMVARLERCSNLEPLLALQWRGFESRLYRLLDADRAAHTMVSNPDRDR
jgi:hypothetical protein